MNQPKEMRSILRATTILGSSSLLTILKGLVTAKITAALLEPKGYGYMGLLQSMVGLGTLVAGLGIGAGLVKKGASQVALDDQTEITRLRQGSWLVVGIMSAIVLVVVAVFRETLGGWFLGVTTESLGIGLRGVAIAITAVSGLQGYILNTYHRVDALAKKAVARTLLSSLVSIALIVIFRTRGIVPAVIGGTVVSWLVTRYFLRREVGGLSHRLPIRECVPAARSLLRFGIPYTGSMMVGTGVQMALPILVVHMLGTESVGFYRASANISVAYHRLSDHGNDSGLLSPGFGRVRSIAGPEPTRE